MTIQSEKDASTQSKRFRLVVRSAEEAVRLIKEKLGDDAKVVSVRQFGGEGLKRFISSPKLEVIAEIPSGNDSDSDETTIGNEDMVEGKSIEKPVEHTGDLMKESQQNESADLGTKKLQSISSDDEIYSLLARSGFDENLLSQIKSWSNWSDVKNSPLADALKKITVGLSDRFKSNPQLSLTNRVALIGTPGSGKTTTLCKVLANEVFINKRLPMVLKIENGVPNPDDSLRIFCEVIGVTLFREFSMLPSSSEQTPLYVDLPGLSLGKVEDWSQTKESLDKCSIDTRVLVINGAYDIRVLNRSIQASKHLGITHLAITHFDELSNATKLWPIILNSGLSPFCICNGQNVTGDFSKGVLNQMISKTFPEEVYSKGFSTYSQF